MTLYIDNRSGSKDLPHHPPLNTPQVHPHITLTSFRTLGLGGDAYFTGNGPNNTTLNIGVEVKTAKELITSLQTGRLQSHQIPEMISCGYDRLYLLYYGNTRPSPKPAQGQRGPYHTLQLYTGPKIIHRKPIRPTAAETWHTSKYGKQPIVYNYLHRALIELDEAGITVLRVNNKREIAYYLWEVLYGWWTKPWDDHTLFHTFNTATDRPPKNNPLLPNIPKPVMARAEIARKLLRNIGWERGIAAGYHFKTTGQMLTCYDVAEWEGIDGFGPVIANNVVKVLTEGLDPATLHNERSSKLSRAMRHIELMERRYQKLKAQVSSMKEGNA